MTNKFVGSGLFTESEDKCLWDMATEHGGKANTQPLFAGQLRVAICENHLEEHTMVLYLRRQGMDIEEIVDLEGGPRNKFSEYTGSKVIDRDTCLRMMPNKQEDEDLSGLTDTELFELFQNRVEGLAP